MAQAFAPQRLAQARGAIGASAGHEGLLQLSGNDGVLHAARALGLAQVPMVAAAADLQGAAGFGEVHVGQLVLKHFDQGVALKFSWPTMAKAFFKMSRWRRTAS